MKEEWARDPARMPLERRIQGALDEAWPYARMGSLQARIQNVQSTQPETDLIGPLG